MSVAWKPELRKLKIYQDLRVALQQLDDRMAGLEARRAEVQQGVTVAEAVLRAKTAARAQCEKQRRGEELEIEVAQTRVKDREAKLFAIKTNKEYQAALKEIAEAKQSVKAREDGVIRLMEQAEALATEITQLSQTLADTQAACTTGLHTLTEEATSFVAERDHKAQACAAAERELAPEVLAAYREIQRRYPDGLAVVVEGKICGGCRMRVLPQLLVELRKEQRLVRCESCQRLLHWEEDVK